jgi:uncharacterized protein with NRDE domain
MCSIILRVTEGGVEIAANRDEMIDRPWDPPGEHWPGIVGGRDTLAGGTWLGLNRHGVVAALLNRHGSLGPAAGKHSRGELPLAMLAHHSAAAAAKAAAPLDAGRYRSFNLVIADAAGAYLARGLEAGAVDCAPLPAGVTMITSGEPNDLTSPRIARHLTRFAATPFADWGELLGDTEGEDAALDISRHSGFGTVCACLLALPRLAPARFLFAAGRPSQTPFTEIPC